VKSIENPHFKTTTPECLLKTAVENFLPLSRQGHKGLTAKLNIFKSQEVGGGKSVSRFDVRQISQRSFI
jgi:hypothetical protein